MAEHFPSRHLHDPRRRVHAQDIALRTIRMQMAG
jgi:hypothetical protein